MDGRVTFLNHADALSVKLDGSAVGEEGLNVPDPVGVSWQHEMQLDVVISRLLYLFSFK